MMSGRDERALLGRLAQGPVSGAALAQDLGLTRAAVWKRIDALRAAGVVITASARRGYALAQPLDLLDAAAIRAELSAAQRRQLAALEIAWSIDSTNSELLRRPVVAPGCAVLLAERQTSGRGRRGRAWTSPLAAQVSLSLSRGFRGGLGRLAGLSLAAGVAVCEALHAQGYAGVRLKWPNDLVVDDGSLRKLGGLLVEGAGEAAGNSRAVVGLGLNVRMPEHAVAALDQPWIDLARLSPHPPPRSVLAGAVLARLLPALDAFEDAGLEPFLPRFAQWDALAGRALCIREEARTWTAQAAGVAADGALRVRTAAGEERRVHAGDVSVRA